MFFLCQASIARSAWVHDFYGNYLWQPSKELKTVTIPFWAGNLVYRFKFIQTEENMSSYSLCKQVGPTTKKLAGHCNIQMLKYINAVKRALRDLKRVCMTFVLFEAENMMREESSPCKCAFIGRLKSDIALFLTGGMTCQNGVLSHLGSSPALVYMS